MKAIAFLVLAACVSSAMSQEVHYRSGYVTKNGTYVAPSYSTNPNGTKFDNFSTQGNVNPYTGEAGTVNPYAPRQYVAPTYVAPSYVAPQYRPVQPPQQPTGNMYQRSVTPMYQQPVTPIYQPPQF